MQTAPERLDTKENNASRLFRGVKNSKWEYREHAGAVGAILIFTAVLFAPLLTGRTFSMVGAHMYAQYPWTGVVPKNPEITGLGYPQTDHAETFYPNTVFATNAIRSGQLPMWLPYSFGGVPLLELGLSGWLYPPRLAAMVLMDPIRQHDFLLFTHLLMAGIGMYALLRVWGANVLGAILGGMVWELNGHNAFWLIFEHVALAAAWFPLMLLAATQAIRKQSFKWAVAAGAALAMALFTGSLHYVYMSALVLACWYATLAVLAATKLLREENRRSALICLSLPACSAVVALALGAAYWLPFMKQLPFVHRAPSTLEYQLGEAIPVKAFASALISPVSAGGPAGQPADFPGFAYTGVIALMLALAALIVALTRLFRRSAPVVLGVVVCCLSLGFALGLGPLVSLLRSALPFFGTLHPHAGFYLFCFGMAVMAAFGMTEGCRFTSRIRLPRRLVLLAACVLVLIEASQLISFARAITPVQPEKPEWLFPETRLIQTLKGLQGSYHILPVYYRHPSGLWWPPVFAGKVAADFELRSGSGYESLLPLPTAALWRTVEQAGALARDIPPAYRPYFYHDMLPINLLEKISVGFLIAPPNTVPSDANGGDALRDGRLQAVYQGQDGWIYKLSGALPRAFLVPQVLIAPDAPASLKMLVDRKFNAREAAIVIGEQAAEQSGLPSDDSQIAALDASATIVTDRLNDVEIEAVTPRTAMMVLNDSWGAGWRAYVDGVEQPVLRVNYAFRGVVAPEGRHRVVFQYKPPALLAGLWISGGTLLLLVVLCSIVGLRAVRRFLQRTAGS
jgi:hypothetical protein